MKRILIVVGMQNDLVTGPVSFEGAASVVEPIRKKIDGEQWDLVRFVTDCHVTKERYAETAEAKVFPEHCIDMEDGEHIISELSDTKWKWVAATNLIEKEAPGRSIGAILQNFVDGLVWDPWTNRGQGYEIHVVGIRASCSVISMAVTLRSDFPCAKIVLDADCIADESEEKLNAAFTVAKSIFCEIENGNKEENENNESN